MKEGLSEATVSKFFDAVGTEIIRTKEIEFDSQMEVSKNNVVKAIVDFPILLQRPVLVKGEQIILGRDEEKVKEFLENVK